jgi:hypothetical protein
MAGRYKSADESIIIPLGFSAVAPYPIVGIGAAPILLYGPAAGYMGLIPLVARDAQDACIMIQNRSTYTIEIGTTTVVPLRGEQILDGHGRIYEVGGQWDGGFFLVNAGGLATAAFTITIMRQA